MSDEQDTSQTDTVGYGRPPKAHQFKPGQSGNPQGRRKGSKNFKTILEAIASTKHPVRTDGEVTHKSMLDIVLMQTGAKAMKGDVKAAQTFIDWCHRAGVFNEDGEAGQEAFGAEDEALLAAFMERRCKSGGGEP
ncbi:MAG: DUF5681 domain-containing protein [Devosia sp.]